MSNAINELIAVLNDSEKNALCEVYYLRCLSVQQIYHFCFLNEYSSLNQCVKQSIYKLVRLELVEILTHQDSYVLFLTSDGVDLVRELLDLPINVITEDKKVIKRGYYRAAELKIQPRFINHQLHLNEFLLQFKKRMKSIEVPLPYHYFDEKYLSSYNSVRPDGLLQFMGMDFLLEMDMSTERASQLQARWNSYYQFLQSQSYQNKKRKIIVFFICEGTKNIKERKALISKTCLEELGSLLSDNFEVFVGDTQELLNVLFQHLIPLYNNTHFISQHAKILLQEYHDFDLYKVNSLVKYPYIGNYSYYLRRVSGDGEVLCELLFDDWRIEQLSVVTNISYLSANSGVFKTRFSDNILYLVLIADEKLLFDTLKTLNLFKFSRIVFTTIERLMEKEFPQAIFSINEFGDVYHFENLSLQERVYEKTI